MPAEARVLSDEPPRLHRLWRRLDDRAVRVLSGSAGNPAGVTDLRLPYVPAPSYMPVRALVRGEQREGHVIGWRGKRVYLQCKTFEGNHLGWLPASAVERR